MTRELGREEMDRAVDYVRGELDEPEQLRFEEQLAGDPELAAEVEELLATDVLLETAGAGALAQERRRPRRLAPLAWAAAAVILIALGLRLVLPAPPSLVRVALLEGAATPEEYLARHGELRGLVPPWADRTRAAAGETNVDASEFVARAGQLDQLAPAGADAALEAGLFFVRVECTEPRTLVVVALPETGAPRRLFPGREPALLGPGVTVLPTPRFAVVDGGESAPAVAHEPGWVVPLGAGSLDVWVASREGAHATVLAEVDDVLTAADPGAALAELFDELGFAVERLAVREPPGG